MEETQNTDLYEDQRPVRYQGLITDCAAPDLEQCVMMNLDLTTSNSTHTKRVISRTVSIPGGMLGFAPAYLNSETGEIMISSFANGSPAPVHLLEGLPADWFISQDVADAPRALKDTISSGYSRDNKFYTREQATAVAQLERTDHASGSAYYDAF